MGGVPWRPTGAQLRRGSALALVVANLVPLAGVLLLGWDLGAVMLLFWAENAIVGAYHIVKLALVTRWLALFLVPFFAFHYGLFTLVHGVFVVAIFVLGDEPSPDALGRVARVVLLVLPGVLALAASHGVSFVTNFVRGGEMRRMREALGGLRFRKTGPDTWAADIAPEELASPERLRGFRDAGSLMTAPYRRVVVLHVTIVLGAFLLALLGSPVSALALLVALKTIVDVRAHVKERARLGPEAGPQASSGIL